ncbi:hypothetical protein [Lactococcus lactis]|uniref:hypothetical protein n=1 Tax=Lactococcus lactis TaxID=1358 RepID=UPI001D18A6B5|nr:hypothetical protein [Lactococcus lactis]MCC4121503.1 hypothetical protein [Lactococcus lactis]
MGTFNAKYYQFYTAYGEGKYSPLFDNDADCLEWLKKNTKFTKFETYSLPFIYITKNGIEPEAEDYYHYQPYFSYYDESEEENKLVEYDFLFATLNEALEFIKPISEKYNEPLIGVSGVCVDDVFNAY